MSTLHRIRAHGSRFRFGRIVCVGIVLAACASEGSADTWVSIGRNPGIQVRRSRGHRPGWGARRSRLFLDGYRRGVGWYQGPWGRHRRQQVPYASMGYRNGRRCDGRMDVEYYVVDRCDQHWPRDCSCRRIWAEPRYYDRCDHMVIVRPRPRSHVRFGNRLRGWEIPKRTWIREPRPQLRRHGGHGHHARGHQGQRLGRRSRH